MQNKLESQVWLFFQQVCDVPTLEALVLASIDNYKGQPGLDPPVRLHESEIGSAGIRALKRALQRHGFNSRSGRESPGYVELRLGLKNHIREQLQWYLMGSGLASEEVQADQLERDLGL